MRISVTRRALLFAIVVFVMVGCIFTYRFPFSISFRRLAPSPTAARTSTISTTAAATSQTSALAQFLKSSKELYLQALRDGRAAEWTVVMGNEAGDLDTLSSSIAYAFFTGEKAVALQQTPRADLRLRPENVFALERSQLDGDELLCIDDIPTDVSYPPPGSKFALVDHNSLNSRFQLASTAQKGSKVDPVRVVGIIDHHEDEHAHSDASTRIVKVPTGSCSSLVAQHFRSNATTASTFPTELARLLLSSILIDTDGLKDGGKAEQADRDAAAFLLSLTTQEAAPQLASNSTVVELTRLLNEKKFDVDSLGARDLLRRDYKEYTIERRESQSVKLGLATVPLGLQRVFELSAARREQGDEQPAEFWHGVDNWMQERSLDALGILCSFKEQKEKKKEKKDAVAKTTKTGRPAGKHRRQILVVAKSEGEFATVADALFAGVEGASELEAERISISELASLKGKKGKSKAASESDARSNGTRARAYDQRNADPSRKVIAPLFRSIISGPQASPPSSQ